MNCATIKTFT